MRRRTTPSRYAGPRALGVLILLLVTACTSADGDDRPGGDPAAENRPVRIAYLQKQGSQQYFVDQAAGARAEAARLGGVEVTVVDVGSDSAKALAELDRAIAAKVDAIAIVVPDQEIGPQVIDKARAAGIPLVASDDEIKDSSGNPAPFVGFDGTLMGRKVGEHAGKLYKSRRWTPDGTAIMAAWKQDLSVCTDRVDGARAAFTDAIGQSLPVIELATDNTASSARDKARAALRRNLHVRRWIVWGCNDENTTGVVSALEASGIAADDIIGIGINADLSCRDWRVGRDSGNKAALFIAGQDIGANAVDMLVDAVRRGRPLPPRTIGRSTIVDARNWRTVGVPCR